MVLVACEAARPFALNVARELGCDLVPTHESWFACGEGKFVIEANIRGCDVYVMQQPIVPNDPRSIYDRTMMLLHAVDAARCADCDRVTVVVPYLPGGRQDKRKRRIREGVTTGLLARMLEGAGADMVLTVEPHNEATVGCYDPRLTVFEAVSIAGPLSRYLQQHGLVAQVVASPDVGGLGTARDQAGRLGCGLAALSKERDYSKENTVARTTVIGDVSGRSVLLIDDIVDTAGSVRSAVHSLWESGATDIIVCGVHMLLSGEGWQRLHELRAEAAAKGVTFRVVGTSSVVHTGAPDWYSTFPLEPLIANVIRRVNQRGSVRAVEDNESA
jgi:ribose-phosphate pyrophosphokinase